MRWRADSAKDVWRWHAVGLAAFAIAAVMYSAATGVDTLDVQLLLGVSCAVIVAVVALGLSRDWQHTRQLLIFWPAAVLVLTIVTGAVDVDATRDLPGIITLSFAYVGLTLPPGRGWYLLPLGVVAYVVGGGFELPGDLAKILLAAVMWMLVAEVPARLIAQLEAQQRELRTTAQTDALTGLLDRTSLAPELAAHSTDASVVIIDLDDFKTFNDTRGHKAGDNMLVSFASALRSSVRPADLVFRLGGDEFLLLLPDTTVEEAQLVVDKLDTRWTESGFAIGFSAGVAGSGEDPLHEADQRMYEHKRLRRSAGPGSQTVGDGDRG